ncbi:hypothetical protein CBS147333_9964 [Penicillium roqueforti]|nr:hypothetical protein CBS147333_9964 [Penicillium roqueforti]KAI3261320.1 hypothetical protein CBS147308_9827 [Penicillium roqueforti]KAI3277977.1 hypothetical protein DTO003C3_9916 [Penicillium roqueforti]KAI3283707.1 hypothetical protein DTO002I6_9458 [Penicillium roqueforti]
MGGLIDQPLTDLYIKNENILMVSWHWKERCDAQQMRPRKDFKSQPTLDKVVEKFTWATAQDVDRITPDIRPTPYFKRWLTADLKTQQEVNQLRGARTRPHQHHCRFSGHAPKASSIDRATENTKASH